MSAADDKQAFQHVSAVMGAVHEGFVSWARAHLREAGLEDVEVYGRFPSEGTTRSHVVCFPYRLGPSPKLIDTTKGVSLLRFKRAHDDKEMFVPDVWAQLGNALAECIDQVYPQPDPKQRQRGQRTRPVGLDELPKPLAGWYRERAKDDLEDPWISEVRGQTIIRVPALWWQPAFHLTTYYIVLANDGGRGTSSRTTVGPPLALPSLSVIAAAVHVRKVLHIEVPALPHSAELDSLMDAMGASVGGEMKERLDDLKARLSATDNVDVGVVPVHDLSNHEFATLMTALNRPLQPSLNLMLRLPLAAQPILSPSVSFGSLDMSERNF